MNMTYKSSIWNYVFLFLYPVTDPSPEFPSQYEVHSSVRKCEENDDVSYFSVHAQMIQ